MKDNSPTIIVIIAAIVMITLLIFFPLSKKVPVGLPDSYYEIIDNVEKSKAIIIIYSDEIDLNGDTHYSNIEWVEDIDIPRNSDVYVVIDMNKYIDNYSSSNEINNLYANNCIKVVIANYKSSNSNYTLSFFDNDDANSDLVFTYNNSYCDSYYTNTTYDSEFPDIVFLNFAIINIISMDYIQED